MTDEESYTISQISEHNEIDDAWVVLDGIVYDISDFLEDESNHPGGITLILEWLGKDISVGGIHILLVDLHSILIQMK